jgi:hypothetical protein
MSNSGCTVIYYATLRLLERKVMLDGGVCPYCTAFKSNWQSKEHKVGEKCTVEMLTAHAVKLESGELNGKNVR